MSTLQYLLKNVYFTMSTLHHTLYNTYTKHGVQCTLPYTRGYTLPMYTLSNHSYSYELTQTLQYNMALMPDISLADQSESCPGTSPHSSSAPPTPAPAAATHSYRRSKSHSFLDSVGWL